MEYTTSLTPFLFKSTTASNLEGHERLESGLSKKMQYRTAYSPPLHPRIKMAALFQTVLLAGNSEVVSPVTSS
jgi:hypothetical protein